MPYGRTAYTATFLGLLAGLVLYLATGFQFPLGLGAIVVELTLLASLIPLARRRGLAPADLGLRKTRGAASVGLVLLGVVAYAGVGALWLKVFGPQACRSCPRR